MSPYREPAARPDYSDPPPMPVTQASPVERGIAFMGIAVVIVQVFGSITGCLTDAQKKDVAFEVYASQQAACIDQYGTKAGIDACRDRVKKAWEKDHPADAGTEGGDK